MIEPAPNLTAAFARLERRLVRRRLAAIEPILRFEIAALGAILSASLFWQSRSRLGSIAFAHGPWAAAVASAQSLAGLALLGGALTAGRHALRLAPGSPAPPWLALPIPASEVHRHLARTSRPLSLWAAVPALAVLASGVHIVPAPALAALAAGFGILLEVAGRVGCAAAFGLAWVRATPCATCDPPTRVLAAAAAPVRTIRLGAARWRRPGAFRAFLSKDALLARRPGPARARLASPWIFGALSVLAWKLPIAPLARASVALALALVAAAGVASWIVALVASDPFPVVRGLPLGVGVVWGARLAWAAFGALALAAGQALGAGLSPAPSPPASFAGTALVTFAIGALGANYGVTLFPNADHAERILGISLLIAITASLMIPFLGWLLLLAALLHSALRLRRWAFREAR